VDDTILQGLADATNSLCADAMWRSLLAENLLWASCESLFQCSLLGALNCLQATIVADREKRLVGAFGKVQPDLLVFDRRDYQAWWRSKQNSPEKLALLKGLVQLKVAWTRGNAIGSAVIAEKARGIAQDAERLARFCGCHDACRAYLAVIISGFHPPTEGMAELNDAIGIIRHRVQEKVVVESERLIGILNDSQLDHWATYGRGSSVLSAGLILVGFRQLVNGPRQAT
jgi:hypothetical protein